MCTVDHAGGLAAVLALIEARAVDAFRLPERDAAIYIDDEGLFPGPPLLGFQVWADGEWSQFFAGRGLVVGTTPDRRDAPAPFTVEEFAPRVRFAAWLPRL